MRRFRFTLVSALILAFSPKFSRADDSSSSTDAKTSGSQEATAEKTEEVVILGARASQSPGSVQIIKSKQLERFEYDDPGAILVQVPGVYLRQEDGVGLRPNIGIRGVNPDRSKKLTLMEDGILFGPAPYSAPAAYFFPLMTRMTSIRVIKGPGSVAYGPQTVGGAIDFISRPIPEMTSGFADAALGDFGYGKGHVFFGTSTDRTGFSLEGIHLHDSGFKSLPSGGDTGSTRNEWIVKLSHILEPHSSVQNTLSLKASYNDEASNETYLGLTDADFRKDPYQRYAASALDRMENHRTGVVLGHLLSDRLNHLTLETKLYRFDYARTWRKVNSLRSASAADALANPESPEYQPLYDVLRGATDSSNSAETILIGPNQRTFVSQGIQSTAHISTKTGPLSHQFEAGIRLHYDSIRRRHSQTGFAMVGGALYPDGTPEQVTSYDLDETHAAALHILDGVSWKSLTVTPGIRGEFLRSSHRDDLTQTSSQRYVAAFLPGVGLYYGIFDFLGVLGGVHRGFSPPAPGSDATTPVENSVNYEFGLRANRNQSRIEVIGFLNDYTNLTDVCTLASGCLDTNLDRQFSAGAAKIGGIEASVEHTFGAGSFSFPLTGSYTFTRATFEDSFASADPIFGKVSAGDEVPYIPQHQGNITFGVETKRARLNASSTYVSRMRELAGSAPLEETIATDEQIWVDLSAEYQILGWLKVYANLRNANDLRAIVSRRPYGARPNAPRWFQIGLKASF